MENTYRELKTDAELLTAAILSMLVTVVDHDSFGSDRVVEPGGIVEAYTHQRVMINGMWHPRRYCSFRIAE